MSYYLEVCRDCYKPVEEKRLLIQKLFKLGRAKHNISLPLNIFK